MSFLYPMFLYVILPLIVVLFYFILTGSQQSYSMFSQEVLDKLRSHNKSLSKKVRQTLFLISFILMSIALAQPVIKEGEIVVEAKSADILIAIDISDSMRAEDSYPNRLEFAKNKAIDILKDAPQNRMGVLAFAKHDYIVSPLSFDHSSVAFLLSKLRTDSITEKGTNLNSMLHSAINMLEHAPTKNLLLISDGGDTDNFDEEIALAKENDLRLFILGVGSDKGSPVPSKEGGFIKYKGDILISKLNSEIKELATQTGGVYIESTLGDADIKAMLNEIAAINDKTTLKEETIPQYTQLFYYPLALAVLFVFLAFSSLPRRSVQTLLLLALVFLNHEDAKAGLLDFNTLENAKEAYEKEEYIRSAEMYEGLSSGSAQARYNQANSLYKAKEYEKALQTYKGVNTEDIALQAKVHHNIGNSHTQLKQYKEALSAYEQSLALHDDKQTKENYEIVKKLLEEQKKEEENKNQDKEQKDKQDQEKDKDKSEEEKQDSSGKKDDKDQEGESKEKKEENKDSQKSDKKDETSKDEQNKKDEGSPEEKNEESQENVEDKEQKEEEQKSEPVQEEKKTEAEEKASESASVSMKEMSELEASKWMKMIKQSQQGHLYKIKDTPYKEDKNEKPW